MTNAEMIWQYIFELEQANSPLPENWSHNDPDDMKIAKLEQAWRRRNAA